MTAAASFESAKFEKRSNPLAARSDGLNNVDGVPDAADIAKTIPQGKD